MASKEIKGKATIGAKQESQSQTADPTDTETHQDPHTVDKGNDNDTDTDISSDDEGSESDSDSSADEQDITARTDIPESLKPRVDRLKELRSRLHKSTQENKKEVYMEHQRQHENPKAQKYNDRKRREAEILNQREEFDGDYERARSWGYTAEQVEKYESKRAKKEDNREHGFSDYTQVNQRKYERDINKLKPDVSAYQKQKDESGEFKLDPKNIDKLAKIVEDQRKKRAQLHTPNIEKEGETVTYINEKNARFNRKVNRAYDKYTKEIHDNFERGTAL